MIQWKDLSAENLLNSGTPSSLVRQRAASALQIPSDAMCITQFPGNAALSANTDLGDALEGLSKNSGTDGNIALSQEQQGVMDLVKSGQNVFFTGPAGTGKSLLLRRVISQLRSSRTHEFNDIAITAPTGIAGLNIGGTTIHSFAGIGLGKESREILVTKIKNSIRSRKRWFKTKVLIVDEISMLDGELFNKLDKKGRKHQQEYIARKVRNNEAPFGGIQLVLCGDFFQLPPVPDKSYGRVQPAVYAFDAKTWSKCISRPIFLKKVFRQQDNAFVDILTNMRHGSLTEMDVEILKSLSRPLVYPDGIEPSQLFPLRYEVEKCNDFRLQALPDPPYMFHAMDGAGNDVRGIPIPSKDAQSLLDRLIAPSLVSLKVGAQVMLIQNLEEGLLVNGSLGKVIAFLNVQDARESGVPVADKPGRNNQTPHHRAPARDVRPLNSHSFSRHQLWPVVQFANGRTVLCPASEFTVEGPIGNVEARRFQVPLILAWALSVHKAQGQTLSRVKVDLARIFEKGQAYVAISRATSMEGLEIQNFQASKVLAHPRVIDWHQFWMGLGDGDLPEDMEDDYDSSD